MSVADRLSSLTPEQKALLELLRKKKARAAGGRVHPPPPVPRLSGATGEGDWPLSMDQERLWFLQQLEPGSTSLNIGSATRMLGPLNLPALHGTLNEIVRRHAAWRTSFPTTADGRPVQRVVPHREQLVSLIDLASLPGEMREPEMHRVLFAGNGAPFDIERGPLVRVVLARLGPLEHACLVTVHHLVTDWLSSQLATREMALLYDAAQWNRPSSLPEPPVQYSDYAVWQRDWIQGEVLEDLLAYWQQQLAGFPLVLELPTDRPRHRVTDPRGGVHTMTTSRQLAESLRGLARRENATIFMTILALFYALVYRFSGQERIILGSNNANRNRPELEPVVGCFLTQIPFALDLTGDPSFRELLGRVRKVALEAYTHQDLPFGKLVEVLQPDRGSGVAPVIQTLIQVLDGQYNEPGIGFSGLGGESIELFDGQARYDLTLVLYDYADSVIQGTLEYDAGILDTTTTARLVDRFFAFAETVVLDPEVRLSRLPSLSAAARHQALTEWNDVSLPVSPTEVGGWTVPERFAAQAARTPAAVALVSAGEPVTFGELDRRAAALAGRLRALGIGPEARVALLAHRSPALVAAIFAVWKAGGACVPLDPTAPPERLAGLLADAEPAVLIHEQELGDGLLPAGTQAISLDEEAGAGGADGSNGGEAAGPRLGDLAYLIYTSGTTGRPKAVMVEHGSLAATLGSLIRRFGLGPDDRMPHLARFSFDIAFFELLAPLLAGGTCELLSMEEVLDTSALLSAVERATRVHGVPSLMRHLAAAAGRRGPKAFDRLRTLLTGGDVVSPDLVAELQDAFPKAEVVAMYGPTEATIICTAWKVPRAARLEKVPLGRPLDGVLLRVMDRDGELALLGAPGELWVGGPGVARGYFRREELTAERFVERDGLRFYRTGDLVRHLPAAGGALEFLGRTDLQVKVSGFRVEPGEVEAALVSHPAVREAVVVARDDGWGDMRLVAYCVPAGAPEECGAAALREHLAGKLPGYMVPSLFEILPELPLTPHGKVDRQRLPAPAVLGTETEDATPRTPAEALVAGIWREVLGVEQVGRSDNFFDLGGHSLLATRVVTRLREVAGVELPVRVVFQTPTVAGLAGEVEALQGAGPPAGDETRIVPVPRQGDLPLSFAQERLWLLDRLTPGMTAYNIPQALSIEGELAPAALAAALAEVVRRQEVLRTTFGEREHRPVQRIAPSSGSWLLPLADLSALPAAARSEEARRLADAEAGRPFDLERGPVMRTTLLRLGAAGHALLLVVHHIASDGWSMGVMTSEIAALYGAAVAGLPSPLPELPVQYGDFAVWQRRWLSGEVLERQLAYWRRQLQGVPVLRLPTDRPRPAEQSFRGAGFAHLMRSGVAQGLRALALRRDATLFMVLLAAVQALLARHAGQTDFALGSPIANRNRSEVEPLIGFFVNTLVLRGDLTGDPHFADLLEQARRLALEGYSHQDLPFERLVEELRPERRLSHNPLFQVMYGVQNAPAGRIDLTGLSFAPLDFRFATSRFDLEVMFWEGDGEIVSQLTYATDLFDETTVRRLAGHLDELLAAAVEDPGLRLSELPLLAAYERQQVLQEWNDTRAELPAATLVDLFREQAARRPGATAVSSADGDLSYAELDARSTRLARRLAALGVKPEEPVALLAERSPSTLVGLLAILKAGGAYLPLDPNYPAERLAWMLADSRVRVLVGQPELLAALPEGLAAGAGAPEVVDLSADPGEAPAQDPVGPLADGLAYVMYTSGSTGTPRAVGVTHANVVRLVRQSGFADLGEEQVFLQLAPLSFDAATLEIWAPLANGGRVALPPPGRLSVEEIGREIAGAGVTSLWLTAGLFHPMVDHGLAALAPLRQLLAGGDVLSPSHVRRALAGLPETTLINGYGPTEGTTFTSCHAIQGEEDTAATVPIGRPIGNTGVFVLDAAMRPVPVGVHGELYAGGGGIARGYRGRPDLTAERFVPDPLTGAPGGRLYRTGDGARLRADGTLEFLGRQDGQVKVRGYRVELGEIEAVLERHPAVREVAVAALETPGRPGDKRLAGYVVLHRTDSTDRTDLAPLNDELRRFVAGALPEPMVPSAFVVMEALPLSPNGKVDRAALPVPERAGGERPDRALPETPLEVELAGLYGEVLGLPPVGRDESFFDLGGHSLMATQLVSRIREAFDVELPLRRLFDSPTVAGLARAIEEQRAEGATFVAGTIPRAPRGPALPLSFAQERLWVLDRLLGAGNTAYSLPLVLRFAGDLEVGAMAATLSEIVRRHESLRTVFAAGDGEPVQVIRPAGPQPLPLVDLMALGERGEDEARRLALDEAVRPFDLGRGPLLRTALVRLGAREHLMVSNMHHIVSDGWSMGVLVNEVAALYGAFRSGLPSPLPELPVQYPDFAVWQRRWLSGETLDRHFAYWRERLAGAPVLELPTDRPRRAVQSFHGGAKGFELGPDLSEAVISLARQRGATPFMVLAAGLFALLSRYSGQPDLTLGSPIANRNRFETEGLIGFFVNTLVLRADVRRSRTFHELVEQVREVTLGAYAHQDLPFEKLVEELQPERDPSRTPLFQVMLALQNAPVSALHLEGLDVLPVDLVATAAKFDLSFSAAEAGGALAGGVEYVTDLYDGTTAFRLCRHWLRLLEEGAAEPEADLATAGLLFEPERHQLLREWNDTRTDVRMVTGEEALLHQLFETRVDEDPAAPAAVWDGESLTYGELETRSNRLARLLRRLGAGPEAPAGVWMERSLDMLVAVFATLKAGAAYLPIDASWPAERAAAVLAGSRAKVVLTRQSHLRAVQDLLWSLPQLDDVVCLDVATEAPPAEPVEAGEVQALWDGVAERAVDWVTAAGFYSSYTGEPFAEAEVIEYRDRVMGLAAPWLGPEKRVLEIGSGSGLILWELAPRVARYVALDPSERTQQANRERAAREGLGQVELETGFAHEIDRFAPGSFDLVILASTVQFFPGLVYLEKVIDRALELLAPGGAVLVADVLDPRRRGDFQRSLAEYGERHPGSAAAAKAAAGAGDNRELQVDEGFFLDLGRHLPAVGEVALHPRREGFANELRFRYDVVLEKAAATHARGERQKRVWTGGHLAALSAERPAPAASPLDLAYVIHTSGSTGAPKGIAVQHRPAVELVRWVNRTFGVGRQDRLLFVTSLAFDLSVYDIFGVLGAGGVLHVVPEETLRNPEQLARLLVETPVTIWDSAPAALQQLAPLFPERVPESRLRLVLLSGDWIPVPLPDQVRSSFPGARVVSLGGATETTVWSNWYPVGAVDPAWPSIPYGRPIDNAVYHVLDERLEPCPIGVPGDLYVGGRCLCVGYAQMPEMTAERFLPDPFTEEPGARLYRTGDRARYGGDGNLEFLGRVDQQVKVRGYRIELEEIEAALARHPGVRDAVVTVRDDVGGDQRLVGYVVPSGQPAPTASQLRSALQQRLPEYMVPWTFVVLDSLPLTANGKVDRKALPAPKVVSGKGYVAPRNELERVIAAAWKEILGLRQVGVHDNLFELGGSSLLVVKLHGRLEQELGRKLSMMDLFRHTTIDALARHLSQEEPQRESGADQARARTQTRREALSQLQQNRSRRRGKPE